MMSQSLKSDAIDSTRGGFTLIELILVVTLIGILAGIAVPRIDFQRDRVDSAALQVSSHMLLAQRIAVMRQHDVRVSFDVGGPNIVIHQDANNDGKFDDGEDTRVEALGEGVQFEVVGNVIYGSGDALTFRDDDAGLPTLVFHRNGSASEEGAVHVTTFPTGGSEGDRAIRLTRATGLARCWNRRSGTWQQGC